MIGVGFEGDGAELEGATGDEPDGGAMGAGVLLLGGAMGLGQSSARAGVTAKTLRASAKAGTTKLKRETMGFIS